MHRRPSSRSLLTLRELVHSYVLTDALLLHYLFIKHSDGAAVEAVVALLPLALTGLDGVAHDGQNFPPADVLGPPRCWSALRSRYR